MDRAEESWRQEPADRAGMSERELSDATAIASRFLARYRDTLTVTLREDLSQQAAMAALARLPEVRDRQRFPAFVRTVARRKRAEAVRATSRLRVLSIDDDEDARRQVYATESSDVVYLLAGCLVQQQELLRELPHLLAELSSLNERLLMSFYEGFTCAELAVRYGTTVDNVKARIYRSRRRLKQLFERRVRPDTGELRPSPQRVRKEKAT